VNPAAAGFAALDGFSTTGMMLMPMAGKVQTNTVTRATVQLWDLTNPTSPQKVDPCTYITEPAEITQQGLSTAIGLQPAGATTSLDPQCVNNASLPVASVFRTRPLKDNTDYAVVVSDGVLDQTGQPIVPGTVASVLQFTHPVVDSNGKSQLAGVDDQTAGALEVMRQKLAPTLAASGFGSGHIAMAYTFRTQSILSVAAQLGALPYQTGNATLAPVPSTTKVYCSGAVSSNPACSTSTVADAFSAYGIDTGVVPSSHVAFVVDTVILTFNKLRCNPGDTTCNDTGAFNPATVAPVVEPINALIALPAPPYGSCTPALPATICTVPLVVFRHGLSGGRADMLRVADKLNENGFAVAAIDANKHGDRSYCKADAECSGGTCVPDPALAAEGDLPGPTPGHCMNGVSPADFVRRPTCGSCTNTKAIPLASSNFLVSANFFRTRDTLRQDIIDQSQLARVLSPNPAAQAPNQITTATLGVQFDFAKIWYAGVSLGAIQGTVNVASNPRFSEAVLNVGGGTVVDIFTTSPAFTTTTNALLAALGIQPGANQDYLQFLVVAKTILDPADPVNFAGHLQSNTLPNLLANPNGTVAQSGKAVLTQAAFCDQVVPNPWNYVLDSTAGTGPFPGDPIPTQPTFGAPGTFQLFFRGTPTPAALASCPSPTSGLPPPAANAVSHGFFADWANATITSQAQTDAAAFLANPATKPPSLRTF
jgi:hypothetical protein